MSKPSTILLVALAAVLFVGCLGCPLAGFSVAGLAWFFRYQPAVVAAPGHEMRWPTRPGPLDSLAMSAQRFLEIRNCEYAVMGWNAEGVLFYEEACQDAPARTWAFDPAGSRQPRLMESLPGDLSREAVARSAVLDLVRSPIVHPADAEPMVRRLEVQQDGVVSPDGQWVAVVVRHIYGPEDVIIVAREPSE